MVSQQVTAKDVNGGYTFNSRYEVSAPAGVPTTDGVYPYSTIVDKYYSITVRQILQYMIITI